MTLKFAMLRAFEYAIDNSTEEYEDIFIFSEKNQLEFSIFDKKFNYARLQSYYDDVSDVSFGIFVTVKKIIQQVDC